MPQTGQEYTAQRFQPSHYDAGYECELPAEARRELAVAPRRLPITQAEDRPAPIRKSESKGPLYFVLAICAVTLASALYISWRQ
jgi:hypothetical protein